MAFIFASCDNIVTPCRRPPLAMAAGAMCRRRRFRVDVIKIRALLFLSFVLFAGEMTGPIQSNGHQAQTTIFEFSAITKVVSRCGERLRRARKPYWLTALLLPVRRWTLRTS